jgi:hypothetical protein
MISPTEKTAQRKSIARSNPFEFAGDGEVPPVPSSVEFRGQPPVRAPAALANSSGLFH